MSAERYGRERVSQIITFGTMAAKAVVRDVGARAGPCPTASSTSIAKLIPFELGMTLDKALDEGRRAAQAPTRTKRTCAS